MTKLRTGELIAGVATGLSTMFVFFRFLSMPIELLTAREIFAWVLFYVLPGLLSTAGAYSHSVRHKSWGLKVVLAIGGLSVVIVLLAFFGGVIGYLGLWWFLSWLAPNLMSLLTGVIALLVFLSERRQQVG